MRPPRHRLLAASCAAARDMAAFWRKYKREAAITLWTILVLGCHLSPEYESNQHSDLARTIKDDEIRAENVARKEAEARGFSVEGHEVSARLVGEYWEISFRDPSLLAPGTFGGDGFGCAA